MSRLNVVSQEVHQAEMVHGRHERLDVRDGHYDQGSDAKASFAHVAVSQSLVRCKRGRELLAQEFRMTGPVDADVIDDENRVDELDLGPILAYELHPIGGYRADPAPELSRPAFPPAMFPELPPQSHKEGLRVVRRLVRHEHTFALEQHDFANVVEARVRDFDLVAACCFSFWLADQTVRQARTRRIHGTQEIIYV